MAEDIKDKLENYRTAPFDARFPNQNQTRNCWSNYLGKTASQGQRTFHTFLSFRNETKALLLHQTRARMFVLWNIERLLHCCLHMALGAIALSKPCGGLSTLEPWAGPEFLTLSITFVVSPTDYHRCQKALDAKGVDTAPCDWYKRVYKSLCPMSWVTVFYFF